MRVKIKTFVHLVSPSYCKPYYTLFSCDMSESDPEYINLGEREVEVEVPDNVDVVPLKIEAMRKAQKSILAEAQAKVANIEEGIQRLLCIEHKPEVV